ncbi:MAG: CoA-binding protein [Desulfobacterales bacterium]|nr:CoA-binding protein [Desulfobacterales bacterium]MDD3082260.1 CoA-binding protein [Desulfobacterales bacterium]MDD3952054.1 CoA-binding protein [Desulfobacterales bacterium]MDD4464066.1 CoA-binding protein [Desulfobacterales bacterium]
MKTVGILGASNKEGRYARIAQEILMKKGYDVVPISIRDADILGLKSYRSIDDVPRKIDTLTVYVSPRNMERHLDAIVRSDIRRVILNPGTESDSIRQRIQDSGKIVVEACTIVMLRTDQFNDS